MCLAGRESESEVEEEDDDDGGKFGRRGSPKRSVIGRRCFGFSSVSGRARSSLGGRGGVAGSTSIWLSCLNEGCGLGSRKVGEGCS